MKMFLSWTSNNLKLKTVNRNKLTSSLFALSLVLLMVGSLGHFFGNFVFKYIFAVGSAGVLIHHMITMYQTHSPDFRQKRLLRIQLFLSLSLILASYSMFTGSTLWIVIVLIFSLVLLMLSFRN